MRSRSGTDPLRSPPSTASKLRAFSAIDFDN